MLKYLVHIKNSHTWQTFLFVFFVIAASIGGAYYIMTYHGIFKRNNAVKEIVNAPIKQVIVPDIAIASEASSVAEVVIFDEELKNQDEAASKKADIPVLPEIVRNKNPETKLTEAKMYTQPQILLGKYIDISLGYQNMVIFEDGKVLDAYQISSGKKGMATPIGSFKIENKSPRAWSKGYGLWMPNWMAILPSGLIGIHELPIWPGGYQEGANHLGTPVSHGCVRLGVVSAKRVYDWAEIGTPVIVHQ